MNVLICYSILSVFGIINTASSSRLAVACTVLLAGIAFQLSINSLLPKVSYLTIMDKYLVGSNVYIAISIIIISIEAYYVNFIVKTNTTPPGKPPGKWLTDYELIVLGGSLTLFHIIWIYKI